MKAITSTHSNSITRVRSKSRKPISLFIISLFLVITQLFAQGVGISESSITPDASAILELRSTTRGFLMPRLTTTNRDLITTLGMTLYNSTTSSIDFYNGSWISLAPLASPTFSGTVGIPAPFNLGGVSVTSTAAKLNFLTSAAGTTGTTSTNIVFSTSPTLVTPNIGAATGTSLSISGALTAQATTNQLVLGTTNTTTLSATAPAASRVITFPDPGAAANVIYDVLSQTISGAKTFSALGTFNLGLTATGAVINLNTAAGAFNTNINNGTSTGSINIGNSASTGITQQVGTGSFSLDGTAGSSYTIGAATTTGSVTIGGSAQATGVTTIRGGTGTGGIGSGTSGIELTPGVAGTINIGNSAGTGAITLGSSSTTQIVNIGDGSGAATVNIADGVTNAKTINIGTGAAMANTITVGGTGANIITIGNTQTTGSVSIGTAMTSGDITIGAASTTAGNGIRFGTSRVVKNYSTAPTVGGTTTLTAAQVLDAGIYVINANSTITFPTAALLIAAMPNPAVGDVITFAIASTGNFTPTIAVGAGGTVGSQTNGVARVTRYLSIRITNVGAPAYTIY